MCFWQKTFWKKFGEDTVVHTGGVRWLQIREISSINELGNFSGIRNQSKEDLFCNELYFSSVMIGFRCFERRLF